MIRPVAKQLLTKWMLQFFIEVTVGIVIVTIEIIMCFNSALHSNVVQLPDRVSIFFITY